MADDRPTYLTLDSYMITRKTGFHSGIPDLLVQDAAGNVVLTVKRDRFGLHAELLDQNGNKVGSINQGGLNKNAILHSRVKYGFFDAQDQPIGQSEPNGTQGGMIVRISLEDPNGTMAAIANIDSNGSYEVTDPNGQKTLATICRGKPNVQSGTGSKALLGNIAHAASNVMLAQDYTVEIKDTTINDLTRLFIIEFALVCSGVGSKG